MRLAGCLGSSLGGTGGFGSLRGQNFTVGRCLRIALGNLGGNLRCAVSRRNRLHARQRRLLLRKAAPSATVRAHFGADFFFPGSR